MSVTASAALAIGILLFGEFDETAGRILGTTGLLALFSLVALPAGILLDQNRSTWLAWVTLALGVTAFGLALVLVWGDWDERDPELLGRTLLAVAAFAGAASQTAATTSRRRPEDTTAAVAVYWAGIALVLLFASLVAVAAWRAIDDTSYFRVLGAVAVADVLAVVLQPLVRRLAGVPRPAGPAAAEHRFRCVLDRPADGLGAGYEVQEDGRSVVCRIPADDFAGGVAAAIRALERSGARVERVERVP